MKKPIIERSRAGVPVQTGIIGFWADSESFKLVHQRVGIDVDIPRCCLNYRILNAVNIEYGRALHFDFFEYFSPWTLVATDRKFKISLRQLKMLYPVHKCFHLEMTG